MFCYLHRFLFDFLEHNVTCLGLNEDDFENF